MATKATKKKAAKKAARSYWRVIYVTGSGKIAKVEDGLGNLVKGKKRKDPQPDEATPKIRDLAAWNDDERCVYSSSGRCYC